MLACYLTWHLRKAWAPLTFTDETPPEQANPHLDPGRSRPAEELEFAEPARWAAPERWAPCGSGWASARRRGAC